ncbi:MAG: tetratricopeptide repeat protein [Acidobacteriota bacterium]
MRISSQATIALTLSALLYAAFLSEVSLGQESATEDPLQRGVYFLEQNQPEQAAAELQKAVQQDPKSYPALYNLGLAYWNLRKLDASLASFQQAHRLQPAEANARYYLGRIHLARGEATQAIQFLKGLVENQITPLADEHYQLGLAYLKAGQGQAAVEVLQAASKRRPEDSSVHEALGRAYQAAGRQADAEKSFARSSQLKDADLEASRLLHLCRQHLEAKDVQQAVEAGHQLVRLSSVEHLVELGVLYGQSGLLEQATEPLQRAVSLDPDRFEAQFNLGLTFLNLGKNDQAEGCFAQAARIAPESFEAHSLLGVVRGQLGRNLQSIESFRRAVSLQPNNLRVVSLLALQYIEGSYYEEAIRLLSALVQSNPSEATLRFLLIQAHHKNQDSVKALELAKTTTQDFPGLAEAHYNLGFQLASFGRFQESKGAFEQALRLNPDYAEAHYSLGDILLKEGQPEAALAHFRQAVSMTPKMIDARVSLGKALLALQRNEEVVKAMEEAIALDPSEPQLHFNLAQAYRGLGQTEKTQQELKIFNRLNQERMKQKDREVPKKFPR